MTDDMQWSGEQEGVIYTRYAVPYGPPQKQSNPQYDVRVYGYYQCNAYVYTASTVQNGKFLWAPTLRRLMNKIWSSV